MDDLRQYVLRIVAAALICGIVSGFLKNSTAQAIVKLICGLFLAVTAIGPIAGYELTIPEEIGQSFSEAADRTVAEGEKMARDALGNIIKEKTEAYILDKAAELNMDISVEIVMSSQDPGLPAAAEISGDAAPYARKKLQSALESELGITKENQQWTGEQ